MSVPRFSPMKLLAIECMLVNSTVIQKSELQTTGDSVLPLSVKVM